MAIPVNLVSAHKGTSPHKDPIFRSHPRRWPAHRGLLIRWPGTGAYPTTAKVAANNDALACADDAHQDCFGHSLMATRPTGHMLLPPRCRRGTCPQLLALAQSPGACSPLKYYRLEGLG
jgi:hypothetical protein